MTRSRAVWLIFALFVIGTAIFIGWGSKELRYVAEESRCQGTFSQLASAISNYHAVNGSYPPLCVRDRTGKRMHSWRVLLLPFMDGEEYFAKYHMAEPWDSPDNRAWAIQAAPEVRRRFQCRSDLDSGLDTTSVVAVEYSSGPNSDQRIVSCDGSQGSFITLVEVHASGISWTAPDDLPVDRVQALLDGSTSQHSAVFLTSDGKVGVWRERNFTFPPDSRKWLKPAATDAVR
jgi:hypothetical protein